MALLARRAQKRKSSEVLDGLDVDSLSQNGLRKACRDCGIEERPYINGKRLIMKATDMRGALKVVQTAAHDAQQAAVRIAKQAAAAGQPAEQQLTAEQAVGQSIEQGFKESDELAAGIAINIQQIAGRPIASPELVSIAAETFTRVKQIIRCCGSEPWDLRL